MFEITAESVFSAAHALRLPDGALEPMHGHDWRVAVTVAAEQLDAMDCVMDFHQLERAIEAVISPWRSRCLNDVPPFADGGRLVVNPSAERVAQQIALGVRPKLPGHVVLVSVAVGEAPGCTAFHRADRGR